MNLRQYQKQNLPPLPRSVWTNPIHFIACGFGFGTFPFFPGTVGTIIAIPIVMVLANYSWITSSIICLILFCIGVYICDITNRDFGTADHPAAIFDEIATFPVVMIGIPLTWYFLLIGFCLFRFFDIVKPGPIRWVDRHIHNGFGVMLDDLLAAIASCALLHAVLFFINFS